MRLRIIQSIITVLFITIMIVGMASMSSGLSHRASVRPSTIRAPKISQQGIAALVTLSPVVTTTSTTMPSPPTTQPVAQSLYDAWTRVAICEEGGWIGSSGAAYPDSLGINATNWYANGGGADESPSAQITVAMRVLDGGQIPDQSGCAPW